MKHKLTNLCILIIVFILLFMNNLEISYANSNNKPSIESEAALLIDNKTGKILYEKNASKKMYPASTTKIMTAILTLENCNLNDIITASYNAVQSVPEGYANAEIQIGEQLSVKQLLQLLLVHSANDSANVLAEHVGGSIDSFVSMMNTKAHELGLSNTHFTNAFGKQDTNHYTTAHDLAAIMQYCLKNDDFRQLAGSASCSIPATNLHSIRQYSSTNDLINPNSNLYYKYLTTGKTGFTTEAGDCLVSSAYKNDLELICVILGGKTTNNVSTRFTETKKLYDYGYNNYSVNQIVSKDDVIIQIQVQNATKETQDLNLIAESSISALVPNEISTDSITPEINLNENISAKIDEGTILGTATYKIDNTEYTTNLLASHDVLESFSIPFSILNIDIIVIALLATYLIFFHKSKNSK